MVRKKRLVFVGYHQNGLNLKKVQTCCLPPKWSFQKRVHFCLPPTWSEPNSFKSMISGSEELTPRTSRWCHVQLGQLSSRNLGILWKKWGHQPNILPTNVFSVLFLFLFFWGAGFPKNALPKATPSKNTHLGKFNKTGTKALLTAFRFSTSGTTPQHNLVVVNSLFCGQTTSGTLPGDGLS